MTPPPPRSTLFPYTTLFRSTDNENARTFLHHPMTHPPHAFVHSLDALCDCGTGVRATWPECPAWGSPRRWDRVSRPKARRTFRTNASLAPVGGNAVRNVPLLN